MSVSHSLLATDYYWPTIGALFFVLIMSRVPEPARRNFNAIFVAGSCGVYLSGGFGRWELLYPLLATPVVYAGLRSYRFIGIALRERLVERVLPEWSGAKNILHLVYPTPRGMLPSVRSLIDYLLIHVPAWLRERGI